MSNNYYLGLDTSNYTTSVAAVDENGKVFFDKRITLNVGKGERGMRQSQALFNHVNNLPEVIKGISGAAEERGLKLGGVGVSVKPRPAEGSYMPCFLPGWSAAAAVAEVNNVPLCEFSHQEGHLAAALYGSEEIRKTGLPYIAYHISGGTTEILMCEGSEVKEIIGGTKDISIGMLIDRTGVALGLKFPCGKELDRLASTYEKKSDNPLCRIKTVEGMMNISGIETQVQRFAAALKPESDISNIANWVLTRCGEAIIDSIYQVTEKTGVQTVLMMGGVSSSSTIRKQLLLEFQPLEGRYTAIYFGQPKYCSDNAAGAALLCRLKVCGLK